MTKGVIKILLLLFLFYAECYCQLYVSKWLIVKEDADKIIYLDTTQIKLSGDILTLWGLTNYREPVYMTSVKQKIARIRTHFFFNVPSKTYSVIGSIYYDENGTAAGETLGSGDEEAKLAVQKGSIAEALFVKGIELTKGEKIKINYQEEKTPPQKSKETADPQQESTGKEYEKGDRIYDPQSGDYLIVPKPVKNEEKKETVKVKEKEPVKQQTKSSDYYDYAAERIIKGAIFSDGNQYAIQISSWKTKSKADSESFKLKRAGHKAFVVKADVPGKGTWYRVRIGFFDSLSQAEAYQQKLPL